MAGQSGSSASFYYFDITKAEFICPDFSGIYGQISVIAILIPNDAALKEGRDNLAPLKENLRYYLKKHHRGIANQLTIHDLCRELSPIQIDIGEIRQLIHELCLEGIPIILTQETPAHIYYAEDPCISNEKNQS